MVAGVSRERGLRPPAHECAVPGRWHVPTAWRVPGTLCCPDRVGPAGAPPGVVPSAPGPAHGSTVSAPGYGRPRSHLEWPPPAGRALRHPHPPPGVRIGRVHGARLTLHDHLKRALPASAGETDRSRQDPRRSGLQAAGQLARRLVRMDGAQPGKRHVVAVRLHADRARGEPDRSCRAVLGLKPGKADCCACPLTGARCVPVPQGAGQCVQPRVAGLL